MAKSKKKKQAKTVDLSAPKTITILVPDVIGDLDKKVLHGVGRLTAAAVSTFDVAQVAIVKTSELSKKIKRRPAWIKGLPEEK
jgi:hypothetical protein